MEELTNLFWQGPDKNERHLNIYSRVLNRFKDMEEEVALEEKETFNRGLEKLNDIYSIISYRYFTNRPGINLLRLDREIGLLHDNFNHGITPIESEYFAFRDEECELIGELIEEHFKDDKEALKYMTKLTFTNWAATGKLGNPNVLRFREKKPTGTKHIDSANDYMGKEISSRFSKKINSGEKLKILDLGAGTGGTIEAVAHWIYQNIPAYTKIDIEFDAIEFNDELIKDLYTKKGLIEREYEGVKINIIQSDIQGYVSNATKYGNKEIYDAATQSYVMHHLLNIDKEETLHNTHTLLKEEGILLWADPNQGKSYINRHFFNLTDEGTLAVFTSPEYALELLNKTGYKSTDVITDPAYISTIVSLIGRDEYKILKENHHNYNGYVCIGIKNDL